MGGVFALRRLAISIIKGSAQPTMLMNHLAFNKALKAGKCAQKTVMYFTRNSREQ